MILTKGKKDDQFLDMFRQHDFKMKSYPLPPPHPPPPLFFPNGNPLPPWQLKVKNMHF